MYSYNPYYGEYLAHYGVLGMKWGIRRYQPYTKGQKGIFKGLKKTYKEKRRVLKAERKYYQAQGKENKAEDTKRRLNDLKESYKKTVKEVTEKFNKENWESYKNKIAESGSLKEVDAIRNELSSDQLWAANNRLKAQNELDKIKYDVDGKLTKVRKITDVINTGVDLAKAGIKVADVVRTVQNMNSSDLDYKPLSKEANAEKASERIRTLKDVKDPTRMPTFSGVRDTSTSYTDKWNATQNRQKGNDKKKESSNQNFGSVKTEKTSKTESVKTEKSSKDNTSSIFSTSTSSYTKPSTYSEIKDRIFGSSSSSKSVNTSNPIVKAAMNTKMDLGTALNTTTKSINTSDYWGGSDWNTTVSSKSLKMKVTDLGYFTGKDNSSLVISGDAHKRLYNTYR